MTLAVLVDNNTFIDQYFLGEPGVSYLIQDNDKKILFDVGYSDIFIANAKNLNINLLDIDFVVLSHGHMDHTWGLVPLIELYKEAQIAAFVHKKATLVAHPLVFNAKTMDGLGAIGSTISNHEASQYFNLHLSEDPFRITDRLAFLGEIERTNDFENKTSIGKILVDGQTKDDFLLDDTALVYTSSQGLVIITACSHAGICNLIEYAKKVCGDHRIVDIIGGFHLMNPSQEQLDKTLEYFKNLNAKKVHACHCVDLKSKIALSKVANLQEVGVSLKLHYT